MFLVCLFCFSRCCLESAGGLSHSPQPLQDSGITREIAQQEAELTGICVHNLQKRRPWLGQRGHKERFTADPDQEDQTDGTRRQKRNRRMHECLYSLRVFAAHDADPRDYDMTSMLGQRIQKRDDFRYELQGYKQAHDELSEARHAAVREELRRTGGPRPPRGSTPAASSAGQPEPPAAEPSERRARSRSPRRARDIRATSKGPMPSAHALPTSMKRKRSRSSSSSPVLSLVPRMQSPPKRLRFAPRPSAAPPKAPPSPTPSYWPSAAPPKAPPSPTPSY